MRRLTDLANPERKHGPNTQQSRSVTLSCAVAPSSNQPSKCGTSTSRIESGREEDETFRFAVRPVRPETVTVVVVTLRPGIGARPVVTDRLASATARLPPCAGVGVMHAH